MKDILSGCKLPLLFSHIILSYSAKLMKQTSHAEHVVADRVLFLCGAL